MKLTPILQRSICAASCAIGLSTLAPHADAAGLLIADGGLGGVLEIKEHDVKVTINKYLIITQCTCLI